MDWTRIFECAAIGLLAPLTILAGGEGTYSPSLDIPLDHDWVLCSPKLSFSPENVFPPTFVDFSCSLASALELYGALVARGEPLILLSVSC